VTAQIKDLAWTKSGQPLQVETTGSTDYAFFTDEELMRERDRQQDQLDELVKHPSASFAVSRLRSSIEREVEAMTAELKQRARSRHPSSRAMTERIRPLRLLSRPSDSD
jgi:hypothetical protein